MNNSLHGLLFLVASCCFPFLLALPHPFSQEAQIMLAAFFQSGLFSLCLSLVFYKHSYLKIILELIYTFLSATNFVCCEIYFLPKDTNQCSFVCMIAWQYLDSFLQFNIFSSLRNVMPLVYKIQIDVMLLNHVYLLFFCKLNTWSWTSF